MKEMLLLLLITMSLDGMKSFILQHDGYLVDTVEIKDFHWPADEAAMRTIPDKPNLIFESADMDIVPFNFVNKFKSCSNIQFHHGLVKSIHINPKLNKVYLYKTRTEHVVIEPGNDYQLVEFSCEKTNLTHIPENIDHLKRLHSLHLSDNLIISVKLDQFDGLSNLAFIDLASNKIKHIYSHGSISMPWLTHLYLEKNQLQHLDVCNWNMPNLSVLSLSFNKLTHFAINHLGELLYLYISGSPLNCVWKENVLKKNLTVYGSSCDEESVGVFALDCPPSNYQLQQQFSNVDSMLNQIDKKISNSDLRNSDLSDRMQKLEALLENLSSKIIEQQNVSNDIVEAIYRMEIERVYSSAKQSP